MKRIYSLLSVGLLSIGLNAQFVALPELETQQSEVIHSEITPGFDYRGGGGVIWSEDFAGGFPAGWSVTDVSGICPWVYSLDGSWGNFSQGGTTAGGPPISSTTGSNGFLIVDPDSANHFNFGQPSGSTYQYLDSYFTTDAIDLSGNFDVILEFEQHFRFNNAPDLEVQVSNDSINWTTWTVQGNTNANDASPDPELISINISAVAGGQSTVYLRFGWSARVYYWMIDDIRIVQVPDYNHSLLFSLITHTGDGYEYARIPQNQLPADLTLGVYAQNVGVLDQTNMVLSAEVRDAASALVMSTSQAFPVVAQNDTAIMENMEPATPLVPGLYDASFLVTSDQDSLDQDLSDDVDDRVFEITSPTDGLYGLDGIDVYPNPVLTTLGTNSFADGADGFMIFAFMRIVNSATFEGAEVIISQNSVPGGEAIFSIHNAADVNAGDVFTIVAESPIIEVTQQHVNEQRIGGAFTTPATLAPGDYFLGVTLNSFGNQSDIIVLDDETVPQPGDAGLIYISFNAQPGPYTNGNAPALRLSMDPTVGINDVEEVDGVGLGQSFPNPTSDITTIPYDLKESANVTLEVVDLSGKVILSLVEGRRPAGAHQIQIDMEELSAGTYFYTLIADDVKLTKRMMVAK